MSQYQRTLDDPKFEVVLDKTGRSLSVSEYTLSSSFLEPTDSFSFRYYSENWDDLRGLEMQPVTLRINDRPQVIGRIEKTTRGNQGSSVFCEGRDYIAELIECNVDPKFILKSGTPLLTAIINLCAPCGIVGAQAPSARIDARTGLPGAGVAEMHQLTKKEVSDLKLKSGRGIYEVSEELLARFGLTLQPILSRSGICIQPPSYDKPSVGRIVRTRGGTSSNLVISGEASRDYSSLPTHCLLTGKQGAPVEKGGTRGTIARWNLADELTDSPAEVKSILREAIASGRREPNEVGQIPGGNLYRLLYHQDDQIGKTQEQLVNAQYRAIAERMKNTLTYTCTVRGHVNPATGYTWANDTMLDIDDDMADVHEPLWCHKVMFKNSIEEGPTTAMEFLRPWSYVVWGE